MEHQSSNHHRIDYIEFVVTDMAESKRFYEAAFGWTFNDYGPDYAGIQKQGGEMGGFRLDTEVTTGGPLVILYSNNLDRTLTKVREAGPPRKNPENECRASHPSPRRSSTSPLPRLDRFVQKFVQR